MSVSLAGTQRALTAAVAGIAGIHAVGYDPKQVTTPAFLVPLPSDGSYRLAKGGLIGLTWELWVLVAKVDSKVANDRLLEYLEADGVRSIPAALAAADLGAGTEEDPRVADSIAVMRFEVERVTYQGVQYTAAGFFVDVLG